jgi:type II secretory pathway pseudopilin PulG
MNRFKGKKGFLLLESVLELLLISIMTITVLATFARTLFILKNSLTEMRDLNLAQNAFISIYTLTKDEIKTTNSYSKNYVYNFKQNGSYIGLDYSPFLKKVTRKTNSGGTLITDNIDFFEFKDNYLTIELEGNTFKMFIKQED